MGKTMNASDFMKRSFSDLTISEQAAVLKARYDEETSEPGSQRIKTRSTIGEEYGLSGSSVGRLLKLNDLIDPLKDMLDRGSLYTKMALQLAFLPENEQQLIYEIAKTGHVKLTVDMAIKLRSHSGVMTEAMIRRYLNVKTIKKKCYKVPARIVEKYFRGMDPNMVDSIVEQALDAWFGKEAADVQEGRSEAFELHARRCDSPLPEDELNTIWNSAVKFYKNTVCTQSGYVEPDEYNSEFDSLKPEDFSDMGEAKALIKEYSDELLYTDATQFLSYDGMCWRENRQKAVGAVEEFLDMQLVESRDQFETAVAHMLAVDPSLDEITVRKGGRALEKLITPQNAEAFQELQTARAYYGFVMKYRNYKHIADTQNTAKPMVATDINLFDAQENYLNTPGGTYDLAKGVNGMMPHKATDLLTKITNCAPGDEGRQLWEDALQLFFCGDQDLIDYVQMTVGMAAVGKVYVEALIIAYGEGRNSKSTFWNTISRVLGTYSGAMSADSLTANCRRNVKPEIAELKGKRLIIASELEEGTRLSTSILKQLCSTDQIRGGKKFKDPFDFTPSHTGQLPSKPKKPCAYPGCPNLTDGRYCPEHQQKVNSNYEQYGRDKATKKRYGRAWKRIRDKYAAEHPFCELCFQRGIIVPTEEIHHKKPLSEGGTHDRSNLIALCKSCHSTIHAKRGDYWGQRAPAKPASWEEDEQ